MNELGELVLDIFNLTETLFIEDVYYFGTGMKTDIHTYYNMIDVFGKFLLDNKIEHKKIHSNGFKCTGFRWSDLRGLLLKRGILEKVF